MAQAERNRWKTYASPEKLVEVLDDEIARAKRYVKPLSLLMVSIDWYGKGNQQLTGTEEERLVGQMVELFTKNVRTIDRIYLYQKGIFTILLPETDKVEALSTAKRLQKIVQGSRFAPPSQRNHIAVKPVIFIGIVSYPWDANAQAEILAAAKFTLDEAMSSDQGHICFLDFEYQHLRDDSQKSYKIRSV